MAMMRSRGGCGNCFVGDIFRTRFQHLWASIVGNRVEDDVLSRCCQVSYHFSAVSKLVPFEIDYRKHVVRVETEFVGIVSRRVRLTIQCRLLIEQFEESYIRETD